MAAVALRMPSSYVPVEAEEMEYLDGGMTRRAAGLLIDAAFLAISICSGVIALKSTLKAIKLLEAEGVGMGKRKLAGQVKSLLGSATKNILGFTISTTASAANLICDVILSGSLGYAVACGLDALDGNYDGEIRFRA